MAEAVKKLRYVVAANIRRCRLGAGWSQEALARETGLHRTFIGHLEGGKTNVSIDNIERIAAALGAPASELLRPDGSPSCRSSAAM